MSWQPVTDDILVFRDSCNVYAVRGEGGCVVVDAGTGAWMDEVEALPARPAALLLTHSFRDHAAGAAAAARAGIPVYAPQYERDLLVDPVQHFRERETYIIYDNLWDLFAPIEPIGIAGAIEDYATATIAGLEIEAVPLPGATISQTGYGMTICGRRHVFCGEAIHSPGRLPRAAPLQYNYNDMPGATNAYLSAQFLRDGGVDVLLPSLGEPILDRTDAALAALQSNLKATAARREENLAGMEAVHDEALVRVSDHVWRSPNAIAQTYFVISDSGRAMSIDYGYLLGPLQWQAYSRPARRRALLHGLADLKRRFGIERLDTVLVSRADGGRPPVRPGGRGAAHGGRTVLIACRAGSGRRASLSFASEARRC